MMQLYLFESFGITSAAAILGFGTGIIISFIMVAQFAVITEMPLMFEVPWASLAFMLVVSLIISIIAPFVTISGINKKSISSIVKGL